MANSVCKEAHKWKKSVSPIKITPDDHYFIAIGFGTGANFQQLLLTLKLMNILVHIVYCQQRLVRYNMFKDILRQLLKESENIIRIFPLKGLFSYLSAQKRKLKGQIHYLWTDPSSSWVVKGIFFWKMFEIWFELKEQKRNEFTLQKNTLYSPSAPHLHHPHAPVTNKD